jgi:hypothetical protein
MVLLATNSGLLTAIIALFSFMYTSKKQREIEKNSMYQQLEFASIDFFRWESLHRETLLRIRKKYPDKIWSDIKINYLSECRIIIEYAIEYSRNIFMCEICKKYSLNV